MCLMRAHRWSSSLEVVLLDEHIVEEVDAEETLAVDEADGLLVAVSSSQLAVCFGLLGGRNLSLLMISSIVFSIPSVLVVPKVDSLPIVLPERMLQLRTLLLTVHSCS